ncbi:MAG: hypothetical protein WD276_00305 [Actinomycetota bacterium]
MKRIWIAIAGVAAALTAVIAWVWISSGEPDGGAARVTPSPATSVVPSQPLVPFEGPTPIELRFCSADEAIFVLESQVAYEEIPVPRAQDHLRTLQGITTELARWIDRRGEAELSRRVVAWSRAFREARMKIGDGADPLVALTPAIRRRNQIENIFTCELDA